MLIMEEDNNISKKLLSLLENKEASKYNLIINIKYSRYITSEFLVTISKIYNKVEFMQLNDDKVYEIKKI